MVKTPPFHGGIMGSNPVGVIIKKKRLVMNQKTTKKVATVIAVILIAAMVLGAFLPYLKNLG